MTRAASFKLILVVITIATFARSITNEFVGWDDPDNLTANERMNPPTWRTVQHYWTHAQEGLYIPVTYTFWAGVAKIAARARGADGSFVLNPWVFHVASLLFHTLSALIVFSILRTQRASNAALLGAMLFAVHPLQVEPVAWASARRICSVGCLRY